jgi:probable O-glycosylation ligase (exosortase A-associated)
MRDIILVLIVAGSLPVILVRPWTGILVWSWLSYMNPHRLCYGFALYLPFAWVVGAATLLGLIFNREPKRVPWTRETVVLGAFTVWMTVTSFFALNATEAWPYWSQVVKIQLMTWVTMVLINSPQRLRALVWTIVVSLGFYGVKGGVFSYLTGGAFRVDGPANSFIGDNNDLAVALVMTLPLMRYLKVTSQRRLVRYGLAIAMLLTVLSVMGTYSRGGFLALIVMGAGLWLKSRRKVMTGAVVLAAFGVLIVFMPAQYLGRIATIQEYGQDSSALGRINAWHFALNLAADRPIVGGGFHSFVPSLFLKYAPEPQNYHAAHSIYFLVLGEQGVVGLGLFLLLGFLAWRAGSRVIQLCRDRHDMQEFGELASAIQVSIAGFAVGGAFAGLAYFDLPYHLVAMLVLLKVFSERQHLEAPESDNETESPPVDLFVPADESA